MTGQEILAVALFALGVMIGWMLCEHARRRDTRRLPLRPALVPEFDELEPARGSRWEDSERYYARPRHQELPPHTTVNNHFYGAVTGWPAPPRVIDYAQLANRELLP